MVCACDVILEYEGEDEKDTHKDSGSPLLYLSVETQDI